MAVTITGAMLKAIGGRGALKTDEIARTYNEFSPRFGLDVEHRAEHFLAQTAHESGGFKYVRELWGPTDAQRRYEGRRDLGNTKPGDGKRYMGRSLIQTTGRANYRDFTAWARLNFPGAPDFEADPAQLEKLPWALLSAFWYWSSRNLNALADMNSLTGITKKINGGTNGLNDRRYRHGLAMRAIAVDNPPLPPKPGDDPQKRPTLRRGSTGKDVRTLQRALGITADGDFGPVTAAAVEAFQRDHNLLPDRVVGPLTWAEIDKESDGS